MQRRRYRPPIQPKQGRRALITLVLLLLLIGALVVIGHLRSRHQATPAKGPVTSTTFETFLSYENHQYEKDCRGQIPTTADLAYWYGHQSACAPRAAGTTTSR